MKEKNGKRVVLAIFAVVFLLSLVAVVVQKVYLPGGAGSPRPAAESGE